MRNIQIFVQDERALIAAMVGGNLKKLVRHGLRLESSLM